MGKNALYKLLTCWGTAGCIHMCYALCTFLDHKYGSISTILFLAEYDCIGP